MAMDKWVRKTFEMMRAEYGTNTFFNCDIIHYMDLSTFIRYRKEAGLRRVIVATPISLEDIVTALNESANDFDDGRVNRPIRFSRDDYFIVWNNQIYRKNQGYAFKD